MAISLEKSRETTILQWRNATWQDYVAVRDRNDLDWQKIAFHRGWLWIIVPRHRLPDLVGEIADTTLSLDLDEQKQLSASLGISEYWVADVKGLRLFAFGLPATGVYEPIETSQVLTGLPIALVEQTLERLITETNTAAANWLMQQLQTRVPPRQPDVSV